MIAYKIFSLTIYFFVDSISDQPKYFLDNVPFIRKLNSTLSIIDFNYVFNSNKVDPKTSLNDLIDLSLKLISTQNVEIQYAAYQILKSLGANLVKNDEDFLNNSPEECHNPLIFNKFEKNLKELDDLVKILLIDFK